MISAQPGTRLSKPRIAPTSPTAADRAKFASRAPGQPMRGRKRRRQQPIQGPRLRTRESRKGRQRSRNRQRLLGPKRNAMLISARPSTGLSMPRIAPTSRTAADRAAFASNRPGASLPPRAGEGPLVPERETARFAGSLKLSGRSRRILLKKSTPQGFCPRWRRSVVAAQAATGSAEWVAGGSLICRLVPPRLCSYGYDARRLRFD